MEDLIIKKYYQKIIDFCLQYIKHNSQDIHIIYIYLSFENNLFFNPYFSNGDRILKKNKLNEISSSSLDNSDEAQSLLDDVCLKELEELKKELALNNSIIQTQIKIIYSTNNKESSFEILYVDQIAYKTTTINIDLAEKWFAELDGVLRPNSLYRMKNIFGDNFLDNIERK